MLWLGGVLQLFGVEREGDVVYGSYVGRWGWTVSYKSEIGLVGSGYIQIELDGGEELGV